MGAMEVVRAIVAEPMAAVMALTAVGCAIGVVSFGVRARDRVLTAAFAVISGVTAWMMATRWRWPE